MAYLDLGTLPRALRKTLDQHFDNDESKRRAVLAPWSKAEFKCLWPDEMHHWGIWRKWILRSSRSRRLRMRYETAFFKMVLHDMSNSGSIFSPEQPFFPTPLTNVGEAMRSPFDEVSDSEFWAMTMQIGSGNAQWIAEQIRRWLPQLREATHNRSWKQKLFGPDRATVLSKMVTETDVCRGGFPSGL